MAFTGNYLTNSFKKDLLEGKHDFTTDTFKLALYTREALLGPETTAYSATNEISETGSYEAGGITLVALGPQRLGSSAVVSFEDAVVTAGAFTTRGGLVYNANTGASVAVLDFGADRISNGNAFVVRFAPISSLSALVQIR